jgi:hypothetical protein
MLKFIRNLFSVDAELNQACGYFEKKWYEESVAHAKTKLLLAEQAAYLLSGDTLESDALQEAVQSAREELWLAEEELNRIS